MILNELQVRSLCYDAGFRNVALQFAVDIARCESGFNAEAHNTNGEDSRGLFQINVAQNANPQYKNLDLFNPAINCAVAYEIFKQNNQTFTRWTCAKMLNMQFPAKISNTIALVIVATITGIVLYYT